MANDLISRKALIAEYDRVHIGPPAGARKLMEDAPTVDAVEVVHARWVEVDDGVLVGQGKHFECSECKMWAMPWRLSNYCPNCGAKMDGGNEE